MLVADRTDDHIKGMVSTWAQSEIGIWCEEHTIGGLQLDTYISPTAYITVIVYGKLDSIDEVFYKLKWSK